MPPDSTLPETRYARSGDVSIAFQVVGNGPVDVIFVPGIVSNIEMLHEVPGYTDFFDRLGPDDGWTTASRQGDSMIDRRMFIGTLHRRRVEHAGDPRDVLHRRLQT